MDKVSITVIGAGVIGLAVAEKLASPNKTLVILEKNPRHGQESSSRNSEVIHAGIYYKPATLKARLCVKGKKLLYDYCRQNDIPHRQTGKLIVAHNDAEIKKLKFLYERGLQNGVTDLKIINSQEITKLEPLIKAEKAIFSPSTGILSTDLFMDSLLEKAQQKGAMLFTQSEVTQVKKTADGYVVEAQNQEPFLSKIIINCAGHNADKVAQTAGIDIKKHVYLQKFVKGEYLTNISRTRRKRLGHSPYSRYCRRIKNRSKFFRNG
jgi:L-2-hydroxyglutarate oxidase LhgO